MDKACRASVMLWLNYYIATYGPQIGKDDGAAAADDLYHDDDPSKPISQRSIANKTKRYHAEVFMEGLMQTFDDLGFPPELVSAYLDKIANVPGMPDELVDAAITRQDKLNEIVPSFKSGIDDIRQEYAGIIGHKPK
jgi:hypothetical protein